jgi:hypothetical protein
VIVTMSEIKKLPVNQENLNVYILTQRNELSLQAKGSFSGFVTYPQKLRQPPGLAVCHGDQRRNHIGYGVRIPHATRDGLAVGRPGRIN